MAGTATIVGGGKVIISLDPDSYTAAQHAIATITVPGGTSVFDLGNTTDTVVAAGSATVNGGPGTGALLFQGGTGDDLAQAGKGNATLLGGAGHDTFLAGTGFTTMVAGSGYDTFVGGTSTDLMDGLGAKSNVFQFDSSLSGGNHMISDFAPGRDKLELVGYDTTAAFKNAQVIGNSTVISLDSGKTSITLTGFTNLHKSDFIK